ncbi:two-component sensor histidine kinase [Coprococcus eutactus]|jgi:signal transduction histidine kinase|uniref:sensor histidine kinase n=1 Tax=unclassified Clostridium TaxID=2614128 RepID=UPI000E546447|nr:MULTISPECIES: ATP-binding protein [unclassified Clostridium]MDD6466470.1 ATP-binding protein [Coprococcus sp.]NSE52746.1 two-component sensor histidine kinase [Coprococcus eutactus]RHV80509.1 two-component sensor histidine kinase [Clostridium sp. OF10-22XD]RGG33290.1 two-component sensor histidine kinase [Clostridium sp. AF23-6LB]RHS53122.1 two-component sensor histidine kinase [Clostridium sp. AM46-21]
MEKSKDENVENKNKNIWKNSRRRISLQVVIFVMIMAGFYLISISMKTVLLQLMLNQRYSDCETLLQENAKNLEYLINDINSETEGTSKTFHGMNTLAYSLSARVMIVDTDYRVAYDSFRLLKDTYIMNNDIYEIMKGDRDERLVREQSYIEYMFPVVNREGYIDDVAVIAVSLESMENERGYLSYRANILICIFMVIGVLTAFFISYMAVRDTRKIKSQLVNMKDGFLGQISSDGLWREAGSVVDNMNGIFAKSQLLEESRQEFVSNVSHELKTPITSMKVLSESILMQDNVPVEMYREFMNDIVLEIDREAQIISDLLTLVKTDKGSDSLNIERVDINELMEVILKRLTPLAEKRSIEITFESFREVEADIDKVKFTLAISNLIENGIKYNVDGGWIRVSLNADHKNLYIKVADSGVGIPEDCVEHIFERFYRVDKARSRDTGGTGLGLAISKNIIVMHKGIINVYSEPGKGTTFTVRVPMNYVK